MDRLVALVPLRGGSKSIPGKNIKLLAGKPLCSFVLEAAYESGIFDRIVVSTDSKQIAAVVRQVCPFAEVLMRPPYLATDTATTESVMMHTAETIDFDTLVTIQATSPLVQKEDFVRAYHLFTKEGLDSLVTAVRVNRFFWSDNGIPQNYDPAHRPRRQDFSGTLMENGAFYFTTRDILSTSRCRLGGKVGVYEMSKVTATEIDEPEDWMYVENHLREKNRTTFEQVFGEIELLVVDVDGTLTDAGMYYSAEGDMLKKFNTRDAKGFSLIREYGVEVALMTSENSPIVQARAKKLGIDHCFVGVKDKYPMLKKFCSSMGKELHQVAYIGDDINDLECIVSVGFSACPADAMPAIKSVVQYISPLLGGFGAVRDVCDLIIEAKR